ncbi:MAG: F0F1 ATP synthase subunit A [Pirellulaceae bacterium]
MNSDSAQLEFVYPVCRRLVRWGLVAGLMAFMIAGSNTTPASGGMWQENPDATQEEGHEEPGEDTSHQEESHGDQTHGEQGHGDDEAHEGDDHGHGDVTNEEFFLGRDHLIDHNSDQYYFEVLSLRFSAEDKSKKVYIPWISPWTEERPLMAQPEGQAGEFIGPITFQPSKFVVLQLLAAAVIFGAFFWLGKRIQSGEPPRGRTWNLLEVMVVYVRDQMAKPAIGSNDYKYFLPFIWTTFFFILAMNLMGMIPMLGTPTSSISVTSAYALVVFVVVLFTGMKKLGVVGFWKAQAPHIDLPVAMKIPMVAGIWAIEVFGLFIKHMVLAVRLFANMFAGHMVLAVLVGFIGAAWGLAINWLVAPGAIGASVALSLLEILVAFIQAYVFAFLTALFIGAAIHPH